MGVTSGLANRKFSGSVIILGVNSTIVMNNVSAIINPSASLVE